MNDFSIGITTFKRRESMLYSLVNSIRSQTNKNIIITINQDYSEQVDTLYMQRMYNFVSEYTNIFLISYPSFTSLSKMWNDIIVNSSTELNLILNDDVKISDGFFESIRNVDVEDCLKINNTFGMFFIQNKCAVDLNFFDERLLAYGEEDGDFVWKYETKYNKKIPNISNNLIDNIQEGYRIENKLHKIDLGHRLVPKFNRDFVQMKYKQDNIGVSGMFGSPHSRTDFEKDLIQYPYETFKRNNKSSL